ncbi:MAG: DMT family transporter [Patescibacteria group bacterium]
MQNKGILLVLSTTIISGVSIFVNQYGVKVVNPYIFTGLKNVVVAVLLLGIILLLKEFNNIKQLNIRNWLWLAIIGLVGGSVPFLMFFKGLSLSTGPEASYIHKFMFVIIAILAPIFLKEKVKWHYLMGLGFLFFGSILLFKINSGFSLSNGNLLIIGATFLWAIENVISKHAINNKISPLIVAWGRMGFGSLFIVLFWVFSNQLSSLATINVGQISWVYLTAVLLFGYVISWYVGLKYIPLTYAVAILALGAPITSLLQLMQGQALTGNQFWGVGFMFSGVILFIVIDRILCLRSKQPVGIQ